MGRWIVISAAGLLLGGCICDEYCFDLDKHSVLPVGCEPAPQAAPASVAPIGDWTQARPEPGLTEEFTGRLGS